MTRDDVKRLHALCVAYLQKNWTETDVIVGSETVQDGLVEFDNVRGIGLRSRLSDTGLMKLSSAVSGMRGKTDG